MKSIRNILNSRFKRNGDFFMTLTEILGYKPKEITDIPDLPKAEVVNIK